MKKLISLFAFVTYILSANLAFATSTGALVPNMEGVNMYPYEVYYDGATDASYQSEAASSASDDVLLPTKTGFSTPTYLYIGSKVPFDIIDFYITTAGASSKMTAGHHYSAQYYDGSAWKTLTYTDNTDNFEAVGEGTWEFEVPDAWSSEDAQTDLFGGITPLFWVRLYPSTGTTVSTQAMAAEIALRAYNVEVTAQDELGTAMEGLEVEDFTVSGGTSNDVAGFRDMEDGVYQLALDTDLADGDYNILIEKDGYVSESLASGELSQATTSLTAEMQFSHKITTINNETGSALTANTVTVGSVSCSISGSTAYCPVTVAGDGTSVSISSVVATKSGYDSATKSLQDERSSNADSQVTTIVGLTESSVATADPTGYFTFLVEETDGTNLTSLVQSDFSVSGGSDNTIYDFDNNGDGTYTYELETENADNTYVVTASVSGYDTESISTGPMTTDDTNTGTLVLDTSSSSTTEAELTITVTNEDGDAMSTLDEDDFDVSGGSDNTIYDFTDNNDGTYELTLAIDGSDNNYSVEVSKDGYVSESISTGEMTGDTSKSVALDFGFKLKVEDEEGDYVSGATVKAGDYETTCSYLGAGYYGCAVPLSETNYEYKVTKDGYETEYGEFSSDRTHDSDAQVSETVSLTEGGSECEADFDDIYGHWAEDYITDLYCREVVNGVDHNSFGPSNDATRAEFLKMALLNAGYDVDDADGEEFTDVSSGDWYYEYVSFAYEEGFVEGYRDDTFLPNNRINRAEALVITMRIAGVDEYDVDGDWDEFDDVDSDDWYAYAVETAADEGIVEGYSDGDFKPQNYITRAEVAAISVRTYNEYYSED